MAASATGRYRLKLATELEEAHALPGPAALARIRELHLREDATPPEDLFGGGIVVDEVNGRVRVRTDLPDQRSGQGRIEVVL